MNKEFVEGCIHMMMDTCGIKNYTISDGADTLLVCRFTAGMCTDIEYVKEKMAAFKGIVSFVTDWSL